MLDWSHPIAVGMIVTSYGIILGGLAKTLRAVSDLRGILTGPDGSNGVRGDVREMITERKAELQVARRNREDDIRERAVMQTQIERLENDHRLLAKRLATLEMQRTQYHPHSQQL